MQAITDADRAAAQALREALADVCGFWFRPGDDGPLCQALARHRIDAEQRLVDRLAPFADKGVPMLGRPDGQRHPDALRGLALRN